MKKASKMGGSGASKIDTFLSHFALLLRGGVRRSKLSQNEVKMVVK